MERCCGDCCWFKWEDFDGFGSCVHDYANYMPRCTDECFNGKYVSNQSARHYTAVLIQVNRYRQDPSTHRLPNPRELGMAIDFAVEYLRTFEKI